MIFTYEDLQNLKEKAHLVTFSDGAYHAHLLDGNDTLYTVSAKCIKRYCRDNSYEANITIGWPDEVEIDNPYNVYKSLKDLYQFKEEADNIIRDKQKAEKVDSFMKYLGG